MIAIACLLLFAASSSVDLVDDPYPIPPGEWNWIPVDLQQRPATIIASYRVKSGSERVRLALVTRADLDHRSGDFPMDTWIATPPGISGGFSFRVPRRGSYALVLDNRASPSEAADVHLIVSLDFGEPEIVRIEPRRQLNVILLSFGFFFGVVTYSARKLLRGVKGGRHAGN
jgi:hypothetical protein